jgi:hypothetical protein
MPTWSTDPVVLLAIAAGGCGVLLLVHARLQSKLLRRRIATGASTKVVDPATGLYSAAAAWQCIRAEANRALRLGRPLDVWIGTAGDAAELDARGRELVFEMPGGAMGIRVDPTRVCVLSCAGSAAAPLDVVDDLDWQSLRVEPGDEAAATALAFVSEVTRG